MKKRAEWNFHMQTHGYHGGIYIPESRELLEGYPKVRNRYSLGHFRGLGIRLEGGEVKAYYKDGNVCIGLPVLV
jgi:hypothetical protein